MIIKLMKRNIDKIVSSLLFVIRVGKNNDNVEIYKFLEVLENKLLRRCLEKSYGV